MRMIAIIASVLAAVAIAFFAIVSSSDVTLEQQSDALSPIPRADCVLVAIENHTVDSGTGGYMTNRLFPREEGVTQSMGGTWSIGDAKTTVEVVFLGSDDRGDHLSITCEQTLEQRTTRSEKTVVFDGTREVLFENDRQRVSVGPGSLDRAAESR